MKEPTITDFGHLIAYILPGLVILVGLSLHFPLIAAWLHGAGENSPSVGGFLYVMLCSLGLGVTASTIRWLVLDNLHHLTGLPHPQWDFGKLGERVDAYELLIEIHYRFYQCYGNSIVAMIVAYVAWRTAPHSAPLSVGMHDLATVVLIMVFLAGSRDSLKKYYARVQALLDG